MQNRIKFYGAAIYVSNLSPPKTLKIVKRRDVIWHSKKPDLE